MAVAKKTAASKPAAKAPAKAPVKKKAAAAKLDVKAGDLLTVADPVSGVHGLHVATADGLDDDGMVSYSRLDSANVMRSDPSAVVSIARTFFVKPTPEAE